MEITPERLVALPDTGTLHPAYLVAGPEMLRVLEAADAVRRMAKAQGIGEREIFDADGRDFDWGNLEAAFHARHGGRDVAAFAQIGGATERRAQGESTSANGQARQGRGGSSHRFLC